MSLRDTLLTAIERANSHGINIDVTNYDRFGRGFVLTDEPRVGYQIIKYQDIYIYDKTGDVMKQYDLYKLTRTGDINAYMYMGFYVINLTEDTDYNVLEDVLKEDYNKVRIPCNSRYIPPEIIEKIAAQILVLEYPIIDEELVAAIPSNFVSIITDAYYPSFESLKCAEFALHYNADAYYNNETEEEYTPIMPPDAINVILGIGYKNNHKNVLFLGNEIMEKLTIRNKSNESHYERVLNLDLGYLPSLRKLTTSVNVFASSHIIQQLEKLKFISSSDEPTPYNIVIERKDDNIHVSVNNDSEAESNIDFNLDNLHTLAGNLLFEETFQCMPNLKKLIMSRPVKNYEYIPKKLKEFRYLGSTLFNDKDETVKFSKYLMTMDSIKRMPIVLSEEDHHYQIRKDVYYDIYIYYFNRLVRFNANIHKEEIPQLEEVQLSNKRYEDRHRTLASMF